MNIEAFSKMNKLINYYDELFMPSIYQYAFEGKLVKNSDGTNYGVSVDSSIKKENGKYIDVSDELKKDVSKEIPFEVPETHKWFRLGDLVKFRPTKKTENGNQIIINTNYLRKKGTTNYASSGKFVYKGEIIMLMDGSNSGEMFEVPIDGYLGSTFSVLQIESECEEYITLFIKMNKHILSGNKRGAAIPHLDKKLFNSLLIPLPPLKEQKEIVKKIKEIEDIINEVK